MIEMGGRKGTLFEFGPATESCPPPVARWKHPLEVQYQPRSERELDVLGRFTSHFSTTIF